MEQEKLTLAKRWKKISSSPTFPRTIIIFFFIVVCLLSVSQGLPFLPLMSDVLVRTFMNMVLVLAMIPSIQAGLGPNFGLPIGIVAGLLGAIIAFELNFVGWIGLFMAIIISLPIAIIAGLVYGHILNKVKGSEMIIATYAGYSMVSFMSIGWILLPFKDSRMIWPLGAGLRNVISLDDAYARMLNDFLSLKILKNTDTGSYVTMFNKSSEYIVENFDSGIYRDVFSVPTGMILFTAIMCLIVWLYTRSSSGVMLKSVGENSKFAVANGINVNYYRIIGATLSTVIGAVGIIVYSQSYGYMQIYQGPLMMAYPAVAAVLIGGGSAKKANILHVLIGTFLFQGLLTIALPVANAIIPEGNLSETIRMIVQNGVILFALTQVGGDK